jgi:NAD(P)-dependent dehydrogenase (short-subunit alcohol dehydrogenase family)
MPNWTTNNISDLSGKTAIVTGANSGIGYFTAYWLAAKGARVVMACRDMDKAQAALKQMQSQNPKLNLDIIRLDLANLDSVCGFAAVFRQRYSTLDILVNNAGVMAIPFHRTDDGFEMQFGTNHLGHFALTGLLIEPLLSTPEARVITVSSMMHRRGKIDFENLNAEQSYGKWPAYNQSKLANLLFAYEFQRRLSASGAKTISLATNPGYAATNLSFVAYQMTGRKTWIAIMRIANRILAQSAEMGALPSLYAATSPKARGGDYIQPRNFTAWGYPKKSESSKISYDIETAQRLWHISEELTGIIYAF